MGIGDDFSALLERSWFQSLLSGVGGALIGVFASFVVNCTLVEISINAFFAYYFGFLFLLIGSIIAYRVYTGDHPKPFMLASFAAMVLISGLMCFMLDESWFMRLSAGSKVPVYAVLGMSVCFALLFALIDVLNYCCTICWNASDGTGPRPLVNTEAQIYLVVVTAAAMGFVFGTIFGVMDVADEKLSNIKMALMREESICYPIGALIGGIAGVINHKLPSGSQTNNAGYNPVHDDDLLDEEF